MKAEDVITLAEKNDVKIVDLKFTDLPGLWQHFSIPATELKNESLWTEGIGFDGSSIRGFQEIHESDMLLLPDPKRVFVDPACSIPTLSVVCNVFDPVTKQPYSRDPRFVAKKAEGFLSRSGIADKSCWGPELECFIFDDVRFSQGVNFASYSVDSVEGEWNSGREENPNLGYKPRLKEGYFPVPPHDSLQDIRSEIMLTLIGCGVPMEVHHHEVATGGQCEFDMKYDTLTSMADKVMLYKYVVKNVARKHGKVATFMPKPLFSDNGSGMHTHQSLWKGDEPLFYDANGYALISDLCKYYIGGLLAHAPALLAFCAPSTNSYKRLVPGYEAPVNLVYSSRNRSAAVRIPMYTTDPAQKRLEFRCPDPSCNPYLAFAAMLMAGLDGVEKKTNPGEPIDENVYALPPERAARIPTVPGSLDEALGALEQDHAFLLKGGVFTKDLLEAWITFKKQQADDLRLRPHPYEFRLYFDA